MLDIFRTLPAIIDSLEAGDEVREALVFMAWRRIAGDMLAEHAVPVRFEDWRLVVAVSGRTWQRHLEDLSPQMIFKLNSALGKNVVKFIEFRIDENTVLADRAARRKINADDGLREAAKAEITPDLVAAAANITDADLRQAFLLAAGACLVKNKQP